MSDTRTISATEIGRMIDEVMDRMRSGRGHTFTVTVHGRPEAVILAPEEYEALTTTRRELAVHDGRSDA